MGWPLRRFIRKCARPISSTNIISQELAWGNLNTEVMGGSWLPGLLEQVGKKKISSASSVSIGSFPLIPDEAE